MSWMNIKHSFLIKLHPSEFFSEQLACNGWIRFIQCTCFQVSRFCTVNDFTCIHVCLCLHFNLILFMFLYYIFQLKLKIKVKIGTKHCLFFWAFSFILMLIDTVNVCVQFCRNCHIVESFFGKLCNFGSNIEGWLIDFMPYWEYFSHI